MKPASLTQEYDGTEEDGDECPGADASRAGQGLCVAHLHFPVAVAQANAHRQCACAALHGVVPVGDHHRDQVDTLQLAVVTGAPCEDACSVVWFWWVQGIFFSRYVTKL